MEIMHWIGIDDHADRYTIAHLRGDEEDATKVFEIVPDERGHARLLRFLGSLHGGVRVVYEAGPCGYELYRRLKAKGIDCQVAAPALTPRKPGEKVKTNRRDARKLARYLRGGNLTMVVVPDQEREALRDLIRGRYATQKDVERLKKRVVHLLLRHGYRYRGGKTAWTQKFWRWLKSIRIAEASSQFVLEESIYELEHRQERLKGYDARIALVAADPGLQPILAGLSTLRGINLLSALTIYTELGDLRRFRTAPQLMSAIGVVPGEYSTGDKTSRLSITKTGNSHVRRVLVEAAWQYARPIRLGATMRARRLGQAPELVAIAEKCEKRLNRRYYRLTSRHKNSNVAIVAVARELLGFIWAIGHSEALRRAS